MRIIDTRWDEVEDEEMLAELYGWVNEKYPLIIWSKNDLKIWVDTHPITIENTYDCIVSDKIISQCKLIYPEVII